MFLTDFFVLISLVGLLVGIGLRMDAELIDLLRYLGLIGPLCLLLLELSLPAAAALTSKLELKRA